MFVMNNEALEINGFPLWEDEERKTVKIMSREMDSKKKLFAEKDGRFFYTITFIPLLH